MAIFDRGLSQSVSGHDCLLRRDWRESERGRASTELLTKETVFTAEEIRVRTRLKTHIEPFNILIVSAGENL